ncbi:MAG: ABC transporter ATP-binding protein [Desulfobacterales bacterium]|jgi:ABC-type multidrug transport system fused ATPase/permease subunit|nr:ABC transporter ATP-binding protein [Desulfobacterales bacterium]MDP6808198.1 ABC transporter ATP-binding protein [Desulfobacterales bacterium]|tara:strand:+ start:28054 stop:29904 length:1851 start_codon:yes stop_codon:yes gene_type:complete
MKSDFGKVWRVLSIKERRQFVLVSGLQTLSGLMDMAGVVSILPFLSVAADPELLKSNAQLGAMQNWTGYSNERFLVLLGVMSLGVLILNQAVRLGSGWYGKFVAERIWWALEKRMFCYYLSQSYVYHLQHSGNALLEKLQIRVNAVVAGFIIPLFSLMGSLFTTVFVLLLLIWAAPVMTLTLFGVMLVFYLLVFQKIKTRLDLYAEVSPEFSSKSFKLIAEALGAIKEIKVRRNAQIYLDLFDPLAKRFCDSNVKIQLFSTVPHGMVEVMAFGGILLVCLLMMSSTGSLQQVIPLLGLYALALRRILPAVQEAYGQITQIRIYRASLRVIYSDLIAARSISEAPVPELRKSEVHLFNQKVELKKLSFAYPGSTRKVLDSVSLIIPNGSLIGIAGGSGAGKTTLIDLILGLFEPSSGSILIGGKTLDENILPGWQIRLGYVPQAAFIADGTVAGNIAFGIPEDQMDLARVKKVAEIAQLSQFIESELPRQYETLVGERGVRLSGGQRQRISIARALYHDPEVLILDEATSALDGITEEKVMNSIRSLSGHKTILLVAHRLTTLQECDTIFLLEDGELIDQGSYQYLMGTNITFKRMARKSIEEEAVESQRTLGKRIT